MLIWERGNVGRALCGRCACAPNLDRSGKVTLLERVTVPLIIVTIGKRPQFHSRVNLNICKFPSINNTFTRSRTCSSSRYESRAPGRVNSAGQMCLDCGARSSNDERGHRATVVYVRVAHGPSGGASATPPSLPPSELLPRYHPNYYSPFQILFLLHYIIN